MDVDSVLENVFAGQQRLSSDEIQRRVAAAGVSPELAAALDALPEGEYAEDEAAEALGQIGELQPDLPPVRSHSGGVPGNELDDDDLLRELGELHRTRDDTLRHGSDDALANHDARLAELEGEYRRRFPEREVDPERVRPAH